MENESLKDWFRSLGFSIDETGEQCIMDALSSLTQWFAVYARELHGLDESVFSLKTSLSKKFNPVLSDKGGMSGFSVDEPVNVGGFLKSLFSDETADQTSVFSVISGKDELQDTFVQLADVSMKRIRESVLFEKTARQEKEKRRIDVFSESPDRIDKIEPEQGRDDISIRFRDLADCVETVPVLHLKMPLQDFLETRQTESAETENDPPEGGRNKGISSQNLVRESLLHGDANIDDVEKINRLSFSGLTERLSGVFSETAGKAFSCPEYASEKTVLSGGNQKGMSMSAEEPSILQGKDTEISETGASLPELFQSTFDRQLLLNGFFGKSVRLNDLQETFTSCRQTWNIGEEMDLQKMMDGLSVRQSDNRVLMAYDRPVADERVTMTEISEADATNRTINITVNGTDSSRDTVNAISQGLMEVDMGMTLRHFKSPMMA